jgi:hypothetical protein
MSQARAVVVSFRRPTRRRRIDLAMALAVLGKAVKVRERALLRQARLLAMVPLEAPGRYEHAKPLGA